MVCPRCITAVITVLNKLGLEPFNVQLGEADTGREPSERELMLLKEQLLLQGFELLEDSRLQIIDRIKTLIINRIHNNGDNRVAFSEFLVAELHKDYSGLSKLFSLQEGITIEQFIILQKIERVKELLQYNQLTLNEIADDLGYSSTAHLSAQFRKTTGVTPTAFRKDNSAARQPLDAVSKTI